MHTLYPHPPTAVQKHNAASDPTWLKLADVAQTLGLSPELMLTAIDAHQLPMRTAQFGRKGLYFVLADDVVRYRVALAWGAVA